MIWNIEFNCNTNYFQQILKSDLDKIHAFDKILVFASKATNLDSDYYRNVHYKNMQETDQNIKKKINREAKKVSEILNLDKKMECYSDRQWVITLKDHKDDFKSNTKCRFINPAKSEIGKSSKKYLETIISNANKILKYSHWKDTSIVIE